MIKSSKIRVIFARFLLPFLTAGLCLIPSQSYAFVPDTVDLKVMADAAAVSSGISTPISVGVAAFSIGMAIGYFGLEYLLGDGSKQQVRIPLTSDPEKAVPAPYAPSTNSGVSVYPTLWHVVGGSNQSTPEAAIDSFCLNNISGSGGCTFRTPVPSAPVGAGATTGDLYAEFTYKLINNWGWGYIVGSNASLPVVTCPSGYTVSGSSCVLSDARAAVPDKSCDFSRSGTTLTQIQDPDCAAALLKMPFVCANGVCTGQGVDSQNRPVIWAVTPRPDGGSYIETKVQKTVDGQTQIQSTKVGVAPSGVVDTVSGDAQAGYIPPSTDGSAATPVTNGSTVKDPTPTQSITFPNDYARTGEAQTAANTLAPKLDTIHHDLTDTVATTDPLEPSVSDMPTFGNTFSNLLGWRLPAHASACPQPSVDLSSVFGAGHVYVMNSHCTLLNNNSTPLHNSMVVVFSILALFIVLRA